MTLKQANMIAEGDDDYESWGKISEEFDNMEND
jgi:hypothetical protein